MSNREELISTTKEKGAAIVVIGAGVIGSSLAMALADLGAENICVVDPDLEGALSSSELNAGGVRATFNQELNILCSKLSINYFSKHAVDVGFKPVGYLWIHGKEALEKGLCAQGRWERAGWPVEVWDVKKLQSYAPFIDKVDDLAGALFGPRDGLLNPNLLKNHFRSRAVAKGVRFLDRLALRSSEISGTGISLVFESLKPVLTREEREKYFTQSGSSVGVLAGSATTIHAEQVVNCAGPWAKDIAKILGYQSPSYNIRRQISLFDCRDLDLSAYGMIVDSSGVYFHPEAGFILGGVAERGTPRGPDFTYDGDIFFQEKIWTPLSERSSKFESLRHLSGWAGLYEVSPDESAIIGEVELGRPKGGGRVFESHSYSGHGVMHSYACGVALAERIVLGRSQLLDLSAFSGTRFHTGKLLPETAVI